MKHEYLKMYVMSVLDTSLGYTLQRHLPICIKNIKPLSDFKNSRPCMFKLCLFLKSHANCLWGASPFSESHKGRVLRIMNSYIVLKGKYFWHKMEIKLIDLWSANALKWVSCPCRIHIRHTLQKYLLVHIRRMKPLAKFKNPRICMLELFLLSRSHMDCMSGSSPL